MREGSPIFLVIEFDHDSRFLLVKTLRRHFPGAIIQECEETDPALAILRSEPVTAVVTHRSLDTDGLELVRQLHDTEPIVPIVMVSSFDCAAAALAAGAAAFLNYDEWPRIGQEVRSVLRSAKSGASATGQLGAAR